MILSRKTNVGGIAWGFLVGATAAEQDIPDGKRGIRRAVCGLVKNAEEPQERATLLSCLTRRQTPGAVNVVSSFISNFF